MKKLLMLLAATALASIGALARDVISLDGEWQFTDPKAGSTVTVRVPHSWDYAKVYGSIFAAAAKTCTYERTVDVSAYQGKRLLLNFEAVNKIAVIKVDGETIATHTGGFSAFYVDITEAARGKTTITLSVDVTNYDKDAMPARADFTQFGGIYRDVYLVAVDPEVSISDQDYGSEGLYLTYTLDDHQATLNPTVVLDSTVEEPVTLQTVVSDAEGNTVASQSETVDLNGSNLQTVNLPGMTLEGVRLWNGLADPYLYTVDVQVIYNGQVVDEVRDRVGFRTYAIKDNKFYLNGELYPLHGVGMHQDYNANTIVTTAEQREADIDNVLEMGANALRLVHYPHNQHTYRLCDEKGLVVWCENPFVSNMIKGEAFWINGIQQTKEMVKQCMNHPSIIVWCIENEVEYKTNYLALLPDQATAKKIGEYLHELAQVVKEIDPTRLIGETVQDNNTYLHDTADWTKDSDIDVNGFNLYPGWYGKFIGATEANKKSLTTGLKSRIKSYSQVITAAAPDVPCLMTEYGAGANVAHHSELGANFQWGSSKGYNSAGQFHPEEYQSYVHECDFMAIFGDKTRKIAASDIWCGFTWALNDFSTYRNEGGIPRLNTKGLITADRQVKKDAFYLYKANWNKTDLFTHICSSRWTTRTNSVTSVKVYSNCDAVELKLNGRSLGAGEKVQDGVFIWTDVRLQMGANTVRSIGTQEGREYTDTCTWSYADPAQRTAISLDGEWSFTDPDVGKAVTVTVPHSWECSTFSDGVYAPRTKTCTYARTVDVSGVQGKRACLEFEGVNNVASIYVDGALMTTHHGGYSTFYVDITDAVAGKTSVALKVEVTNMSEDSIPVNADFTHWAGIYRDVHLVTANKELSFSHADYGSDGVYLKTDVDLATGTATVTPQAVVDVNLAKGTSYKVKVSVNDADGNEVGVTRVTATSDGKAGTRTLALPAIAIANAHLWQGREDPYLYDVTAKVYIGSGTLVDTVTDRIGLRTFRAERGAFYLNGKPYPVRGVGMHQDRDAARNNTTHAERMADIDAALEMGATAIRAVHYAHNKDVYARLDEAGLLVWMEMPFNNVFLNTDAFKNNAKTNALELVKQNCNRCSAIIWSIANEVSLTAARKQQYPTQGTVTELASFMKDLAHTVHTADPSRLVAHAQISGAENCAQAAQWDTADSDVGLVGFNFYRGWYSAATNGKPVNRADIRAAFTKNITSQAAIFDASSGGKDTYVLSEYGAGANVAQHTDLSTFVWGGKTGAGYLSTGDFHPEEYQGFVHEAAIATFYGDGTLGITRDKNIWGAFAWALFDFSCYRNEGSMPRVNTKGLITADRQTKKDAFYLYKANWNKTEPFTHICSSRWTTRTNSVTSVKVYSNCDTVRLVVNGVDRGAMTTVQDGVFEMSGITLRCGDRENVVKAIGTKNGTTVSDVCSSWKVPGNTFTVRFNRNDGSGDTATQTFTNGVAQCLLWKDSKLKWTTPTGRSFLGWALTADATTAKYTNGQGVKNIAPVGTTLDLYAVWKGVVTVRYHQNLGADVTATQSIQAGTWTQLRWKSSGLKWPTPAGKRFVGWATTANAVVARYANGAYVTDPADAGTTLNLYALYAVEDGYTVHFYRNYTASDTVDAYQGIARTVATCLAWKNSKLGWADPVGRSFLGWSTSRTATRATYKNGQGVKGLAAKGATITLYAVWSAPATSTAAVRTTSAATAAAKALASGRHSGPLADGSGVYELQLDATAAGDTFTALLHVEANGDCVTTACLVTLEGDTARALAADGEIYELVW